MQLPSGTSVELGATWFHGVHDNPVYDLAVWLGVVKDVRGDLGKCVMTMAIGGMEYSMFVDQRNIVQPMYHIELLPDSFLRTCRGSEA